MKKIQAGILLLFYAIHKGISICSTEYGGEPCQFVPAMPGKTPPCAKPGSTYCEHPEHYPEHLIQYLVEKSMYNPKRLLKNESPEEFSSYAIPSHINYKPNIHHNVYDSPIYQPTDNYQHNFYLPPPQHNYTDFEGYTDDRPAIPFYHEPPSKVRYSFKPSRYNFPSRPPRFPSYSAIGPPPSSYYPTEEWWRRNGRSRNKNQSFISKRKKRSSQQTDPVNSNLNNSTDTTRKKRQNTPSGQSLCTTRSQYIMPRAALNNRGNWKYVVNMPDDNMQQLVKSETCLSQQCSGLCSLPNNYVSRCEQKYIQKRLVALEGSGDELYTDVFWFPSCCVCTIFLNT